jgi:hypothetical protein
MNYNAAAFLARAKTSIHLDQTTYSRQKRFPEGLSDHRETDNTPLNPKSQILLIAV